MIGLKHGDLKAIAEELGLRHGTVRSFVQGRFKSKRIEAAIKRRQEENFKEFQESKKKGKKK